MYEWFLKKIYYNRVQASAICQALLEGGYIICLSDPCSFIDGYAVYKPGSLTAPEQVCNFEVAHQDEPSWVQQIPQQEPSTTGRKIFSDKVVLWYFYLFRTNVLIRQCVLVKLLITNDIALFLHTLHNYWVFTHCISNFLKHVACYFSLSWSFHVFFFILKHFF